MKTLLLILFLLFALTTYSQSITINGVQKHGRVHNLVNEHNLSHPDDLILTGSLRLIVSNYLTGAEYINQPNAYAANVNVNLILMNLGLSGTVKVKIVWWDDLEDKQVLYEFGHPSTPINCNNCYCIM